MRPILYFWIAIIFSYHYQEHEISAKRMQQMTWYDAIDFTIDEKCISAEIILKHQSQPEKEALVQLLVTLENPKHTDFSPETQTGQAQPLTLNPPSGFGTQSLQPGPNVESRVHSPQSSPGCTNELLCGFHG